MHPQRGSNRCPNRFERWSQWRPGNDSRFLFENAAINLDGSNQGFYIVNEEAYSKIDGLSKEYQQIGSFNKNHIPNLSDGHLNDYVSEIQVNCMTLDHLFKKNKIETLGLFLIDAEGYDWKILSQLDLKKYQPKIIVFEFCNLEEQEKQNAIAFLKEQYHIFSFRINMFCFQKEILKNSDFKKLESKLVND